MYEYTSLPTSWAKVNEEITNFASEGWELVCVTTNENGDLPVPLVIFLKREKS